MRTLAVVCARKGSKRLPGKNTLEIGDIPLYVYPYLAAIDSVATAVVVSTDDPKIFKRGLFPTPAAPLKGGIIRRPAELATDTASIHWALIHAAASGEVTQGCNFDAVICLLANVPTTTTETINACIAQLEANSKATAVIAVKEACCPIEWQYMHRKGGRYIRRTLFGGGSVRNYRMQDLDKRYIATGSCCIVRRETLMLCQEDDAHAWLGDKIEPYVERGPTIEVDDEIGFQMAKAWLERSDA